MPEQYEPDSGKTKTYQQSIAVYDGSNPAYFKNWHAKVLSHYATWLNGEERAGHWKQHLVSDGCFIDMPSPELDDRYLKLFRPHLAAGQTTSSGTRSNNNHNNRRHDDEQNDDYDYDYDNDGYHTDEDHTCRQCGGYGHSADQCPSDICGRM